MRHAFLEISLETIEGIFWFCLAQQGMVDHPDCHRLIINGHADRAGTDNRAVYLHAVLNYGEQVMLVKQPDHIHVQGVAGFVRSNFADKAAAINESHGRQ